MGPAPPVRRLPKPHRIRLEEQGCRVKAPARPHGEAGVPSDDLGAICVARAPAAAAVLMLTWLRPRAENTSGGVAQAWTRTMHGRAGRATRTPALGTAVDDSKRQLGCCSTAAYAQSRVSPQRGPTTHTAPARPAEGMRMALPRPRTWALGRHSPAGRILRRHPDHLPRVSVDYTGLALLSSGKGEPV